MSDMADDAVRSGIVPHNPFIKRLLRYYQESAEHSLEGPTPCSLADCDDMVKVEMVRTDRETLIGHSDGGRLGAMPSLVAVSRLRGDPHRRLETTLEGESISCFVVGGERRLCVPQMLNTVLSRFSLSEIHTACDSLRINIALADDRQLTVLRRDGILPQTAHGCGLVTLTDAQRLCGVLLGNHRGTRPSSPTATADEPSDAIPVVHRCFGKCVGSLRPSTRLVRCAACRHEFDVQQFVCHSHGDQESHTCHWGFDAANWRVYLQLIPDVADDERLQNYLDYFKDNAHVTASNFRKRRESTGEDMKYTDMKDKRRRSDDVVETCAGCSSRRVTGHSDDRCQWSSCRPRPNDCHQHPPTTLPSFHRWLDDGGFVPNMSVTATTTTTTSCLQRPTAAHVLSNGTTSASDSAAAGSATSLLQPEADCSRGLCSAGSQSVVEILKAEYQLFKSAVCGGMSGLSTGRQCLLDEFTRLQQRHASQVADLLRSHAHLKQEVTVLHETLGAKLLAATAETETRRRQIEAMRREDEAKLRAARSENEALREELEAMVTGAKRTDIGLVKAKYKARAKHFQCKVEMVEHSNAQLVSELSSARDTLRRYQASSSSVSSSSSSPASGAAAAGPLPASPSLLAAAESALPADT